MFPWPLLPPEIRMTILEFLAAGIGKYSKYGLVHYAVVCKDWHAYLEGKFFRHITLTQYHLESLLWLLDQRRFLVEYIHLRVELNKYGCPDCRRLTQCPDDNSAIFSMSIHKLFLILSTLDHYNDTSTRKVDLEISVYSPSDFQHGFKGDFKALQDELNDQFGPVQDPKHGWLNGQRMTAPSEWEVLRIFEQVHFRSELTTVKAVKSLTIRRETRRRLSTEVLRRILYRLPNLEYMHYEPWRDFIRMRWGRYPRDADLQKIIMSRIPKTTRVLTLFEDFNEDYNIVVSDSSLSKKLRFPPELIRTSSPGMGRALARRSLELEKLFAAYLVDATDFFEACGWDWTWTKLTSLALTSRVLVANTQELEINFLLRKAGIVAQRMPKLTTMEIWNGGRRYACVFRYRATSHSTTLSWCGTRDLKLEADVLRIWGQVSLLYTSYELTVLPNIILDVQRIKSHGAAIHELNLDQNVIHQVSLNQIQRESQKYFYKDHGS